MVAIAKNLSLLDAAKIDFKEKTTGEEASSSPPSPSQP
jgi:hypothetical protein